MALLTRASTAHMDTVTGMKASQLSGFIAGEALDIAAPCYIKSSNGLVYMSNGTAANEASKVDGFTPRAVAVGQPVTLFGPGTRFEYAASGLTIGDPLYVGATKGRLDDAPTVGGTIPVAKVISATEIVVTANVVTPGNKPAVKVALINGGSAGAHTVTGITTDDDLIAVFEQDGTSGLLTDLTSEFTVSDVDEIDNTSGTATTSDKLLVIYQDNS